MVKPEEVIDIKKSSRINYSIDNKITGIEGIIHVYPHKWDDFAESTLLWERFRRRLKREDSIAEINLFLPHGDSDKLQEYLEKIGHKGLGGYVLDQVILDLKKEDFKGIYVYNPEKEFYNLLLKRDFTMVNSKGIRELFKILE